MRKILKTTLTSQFLSLDLAQAAHLGVVGEPGQTHKPPQTADFSEAHLLGQKEPAEEVQESWKPPMFSFQA